MCVYTDGGWTEGTKQILFNWIEECAGAGAGHWRGGEGKTMVEREMYNVDATHYHTYTTIKYNNQEYKNIYTCNEC